jgi:hypothetical protein
MASPTAARPATTGSVAVGRPFRKTFITDVNCSFRSNRLALSSRGPLILADQAVRALNEVNLDFHVVRAR